MKNNTWRGKHGPLLIAEIGGNHEGNFEYAKKLTQLAIASDVDFVKFQLYSGNTLVSRIESPDRNKHFKKFELQQSEYLELAHMCQDGGVQFMASVWDPDYISWIDSFSPIYKIGSGDLTAYPVLRSFAKIGKPLLVSTGLASMEEVEASVRFIQNENPIYKNPEYLALLQCTSMYPIPYSDANLAVMDAYRNRFMLPVGYSDHTEGSRALNTAVAMGAEILEFHFTDNREGKTFRDHKVSLTPEEIRALIREIGDIEDLRGSSVKKPLEVEGEHLISFRRAIYPKIDLKRGEVLNEENLISLRPNHGIDAREYDKLLGKRLLEDVKAHQKLTWNMVQ